MTIYYTLLKKIFIHFLLIFFIYKNVAYSEIINKIDISGNDRLARETIILFSELNLNDDINSEDLNSAFKKLYETNYFKDIKIDFFKGQLKINVTENPLVQSIIINGVNNKSILNELSKITKKIEKYPYLENKIIDLGPKSSDSVESTSTSNLASGSTITPDPFSLFFNL